MEDSALPPRGLEGMNRWIGYAEGSAMGETEVEDTFGLVPIQAGMLFHTLVSDTAGVEIEQIVYRLPEEIVASSLSAAWNATVAQHPALRVRLSFRGRTDPVQQVLRAVHVPLRVEDWSQRSSATQEVGLARWIEEDRARGIELSRAPMMRVTLFRLAPAQHVLVWTFHHAMLDGRSMETVLEEVFLRYEASVRDGHYEPPRRRSFRDHVAAIEARDAGAQSEHFRQYLAGFSEPTPLPVVGRARTGRARHREVEALVGENTIARLDALGAERGFSLANAICAAWAIVLGVYARKDDVLFGVTRACRHAIEDGDSVVGCLINTVPLRVRLADDASVADLCVALRQDSLAVRPFETTALSLIREASSVPTHQPLFETFVVFEKSVLDASLKARGGAFAARTATLLAESAAPLALACYRTRSDLLVAIEYEANRATEREARALCDRVACLLGRFAEAPDTTLGGLDRLVPGEEEELSGLESRAVDSVAPARAGASFADLFERVTQACSDQVAIAEVASGRALSYAELETRVADMAGGLAKLGVGEGDRVVVACARSIEAVTAMLAIQRVHAAYVPLDPTYPDARLALVVDDALPKLVVADQEVLQRVAGRAACVDVRGIEAGARPRMRAPDPEAPAYLIYTSGSTGRPKGVVVPHRAVGAHAMAAIETYGLTRADRVLQFASLSFDISVEEIFPTLAAGASLFLRSPGMATSMATLVAEIDRNAITVLQLPTSFFHELVPHLERTRQMPRSVRLVVVGGERASAAAYERFAAIAPGVRWINAYGPTEATVTATTAEPARLARVPGGEVPIGRPFGRSRIYLVDRARRRVPRGARGEIAIGGPQVALGYFGDPEKTRARFFADPFDAHGGSAYASGDVGFWRPDGELELVGRVDDQVKIRGFRVEPGEVEAALASLPEVETAVVMARADAAGELSLFAWATVRTPIDRHALRERLRGIVPAHLVPARIAILDALPIGPGGKIDKDALPTPEPSERRRLARPRGGLETKVLAIYREVLASPTVGVEDDFFEVGGHSLRGVRRVSRHGDVLGKPVGLAALYEARTARALAAAIESGRASGDDGTLVPLVRGRPDRAPVVCVCGVHLYETLARAIGEERSVYGLFVPVEERSFRDGETLRTEELADAYLTTIRRSLGDVPFAILGVSFGGIVAYEMAQQVRARGQTTSLVMLDSLLPRMLTRSGSAIERAQDAIASVRREPRAVLRRIVERLPGNRRPRTDDASGRELEDIVAMRDETFRAALEAYEPVIRPLLGDVALFVSQDRDPRAVQDVARQWRELLPAASLIAEVPGDHLGILEEPGVLQIAREVAPLFSRLDPPRAET